MSVVNFNWNPKVGHSNPSFATYFSNDNNNTFFKFVSIRTTRVPTYSSVGRSDDCNKRLLKSWGQYFKSVFQYFFLNENNNIFFEPVRRIAVLPSNDWLVDRAEDNNRLQLQSLRRWFKSISQELFSNENNRFFKTIRIIPTFLAFVLKILESISILSFLNKPPVLRLTLRLFCLFSLVSFPY